MVRRRHGELNQVCRDAGVAQAAFQTSVRANSVGLLRRPCSHTSSMGAGPQSDNACGAQPVEGPVRVQERLLGVRLAIRPVVRERVDDWSARGSKESQAQRSAVVGSGFRRPVYLINGNGGVVGNGFPAGRGAQTTHTTHTRQNCSSGNGAPSRKQHEQKGQRTG